MKPETTTKIVVGMLLSAVLLSVAIVGAFYLAFPAPPIEMIEQQLGNLEPVQANDEFEDEFEEELDQVPDDYAKIASTAGPKIRKPLKPKPVEKNEPATTVAVDQIHGKKIIETLTGKCVGIADGDTLKILIDNKQVRVRCEAIDCPEHDQPFGKKAKQAISDLAFGKTVTVHSTGQDRYQRTLGFVVVDGVNLSERMIQDGLAWHYKYYSKSDELATMEEKAKADKVGLWADENPIAPWDWRKKK